MPEIKAYGKSLYELAAEEGVKDKILSDLRGLAKLFGENPDYVKILDSPRIDRDELTKMLNQDFYESVSTYTLNFLKILCGKRMAHHLDDCLKEYEKLYNEDGNIKLVTVTAAKELSSETVKKLIARLEEKIDAAIVLKSRIDKECIGGIIIETEDMKIDKSLKSEFENIRKALTQE